MLELLAAEKQIKFLPISNQGQQCQAEVFLIDAKGRSFDVAKTLVSLGFARTVPLTQEINLQSDKSFQRYYKQLKSSESRARWLRKGQWSQLHENWLRWKLRTQLDKLFFNLKPNDRKIPAIVRA